MLTAENYWFFEDGALNLASPEISLAYKRFCINNGQLQVMIAGKLRPVFYTNAQPNISLEFNRRQNKHMVTVYYGPNLDSSTFFVGDNEAAVVDSILVWLIQPDNAHTYLKK